MNRLGRGSAVEFIGTFFFVFFSAGAIITGGNAGAPLLTAALASGLALAIAITVCIPVSGGQLNPAVSIGLVVARKQAPPTAAAYIIAQLLGAASGAGMLQLILSPDKANGNTARLGATIGSFTDAGHVLGVVGVELLCTFFVMLAYLASVADKRAPKLGGFATGFAVAVCSLFAGSWTGASMNPARTFGPAICGAHWEMHWAYWVAPVIGACLAAIAYTALWEQPPLAGAGVPGPRRPGPDELEVASATIEITERRIG